MNCEVRTICLKDVMEYEFMEKKREKVTNQMKFSGPICNFRASDFEIEFCDLGFELRILRQ